MVSLPPCKLSGYICVGSYVCMVNNAVRRLNVIFSFRISNVPHGPSAKFLVQNGECLLALCVRQVCRKYDLNSP